MAETREAGKSGEQSALELASEGQSIPPEGRTTVPLWRPGPETKIKEERPAAPEETSKLDRLRSKMEELLLSEDDPYAANERAWCMDDKLCLLRFLRAGKGNEEEGLKRAKETLEWRRHIKPDLITPESIKEEASTGKIVLSGIDIDGRPVLQVIPSRENTQPSENQVRHMIFQIERVCDIMPSGVSKMTLLVDFHGATAKSSPDMHTTREVIDVFQKHYCERLGRAVIVNLPWYLKTFFTAISPLLDPATREKMVFSDKKVRELIPASHLDARYGGKHNYDYDPEVYLKGLCEFCGIGEDGKRTRPRKATADENETEEGHEDVPAEPTSTNEKRAPRGGIMGSRRSSRQSWRSSGGEKKNRRTSLSQIFHRHSVSSDSPPNGNAQNEKKGHDRKRARSESGDSATVHQQKKWVLRLLCANPETFEDIREKPRNGSDAPLATPLPSDVEFSRFSNTAKISSGEADALEREVHAGAPVHRPLPETFDAIPNASKDKPAPLTPGVDAIADSIADASLQAYDQLRGAPGIGSVLRTYSRDEAVAVQRPEELERRFTKDENADLGFNVQEGPAPVPAHS